MFGNWEAQPAGTVQVQDAAPRLDMIVPVDPLGAVYVRVCLNVDTAAPAVLMVMLLPRGAEETDSVGVVARGMVGNVMVLDISASEAPLTFPGSK